MCLVKLLREVMSVINYGFCINFDWSSLFALGHMDCGVISQMMIYHDRRSGVQGQIGIATEYVIHCIGPSTSASERIVDSPFVQRLRDIRQLGFSHYPFPGATHTRFIHSLGVMHLAGRVFDAVFDDKPFVSSLRRLSLRSCLRLAALLHDIGHGPFSHTAEFAMPNIHALGFTDKPDRRAAHEDYTVAILLHSDLAPLIEKNFPFTSKHVAALIDHHIKLQDDFHA